MLRVIPSNKLENLFEALQHIVAAQPTGPFERTTIIVQNQGIQHWLNTQLAQRQGISFNIEFPMPVRFVWGCIRQLVGTENVDAVSPFSREPLTWSINQFLGTDQVINDPSFKRATDYWQTGAFQDLKRFQLAGQLADLFEQYTIYRDDWLEQWSRGESIPDLANHPDAQWQAKLWRMLCERHGKNQQPAYLRELALQNASPESELPDVIHVFGVNSLAPAWLNFLERLSEKTGMQVFIYHLNPCVEYWGDLSRNKARLEKWQEDDFSNNPLLANLGGQGQQFVRMLADADYDTLDLFDDVRPSDGDTDALLNEVQSDLLNLDTHPSPELVKDNSLKIVSADSPLREIQLLHDQLLHLFNNDASLKPHDIVVMCPQIETYAPFIEAVFAPRGEYDSSRLPCSIADRSVHESEPLVAQFIQLLDTPSRRYTRAEVLDMLSISACQRRFDISADDLPIIERWLDEVSIFWGLDEPNQQRIIENDQPMPLYHWQQGLERLMLGYLHGDEEILVNGRVWSPAVQLGESELLGALIDAITTLGSARSIVGYEHTPKGWATALRELYQNLFSPNDEDSVADNAIDNAIVALALVEQIDPSPISLDVVKEFLTGKFVEPSRRQQFLTGQVTFCSMMPMRSVPFKVVALLGMNDGEFPRAKPPAQLDLIAHKPRTGDRSRAGDDRYLFLEAMISARQNLYISYLGRDRRKGNALEPSLVVAELVNYLQNTKQWPEKGSIDQAPLHPFDERHFTAGSQWQSFATQWMTFTGQGEQDNKPVTNSLRELPDTMSTGDIVRCLERPAQSFGRYQFDLRLPDIEADSLEEPFAIDPLSRYQLRNQAIDSMLTDGVACSFELDKASGRVPQSPTTDEQLNDWQTFAEQLSNEFKDVSPEPIKLTQVDLNIAGIQLTAALPLVERQLMFYRAGTARDSHVIEWGIAHLVGTVLGLVDSTFAYSDKSQQLMQTSFNPVDVGQAEQWLEAIVTAAKDNLTQPKVTMAAIASAFVKAKEPFDQAALNKQWFSSRHDFTRKPDAELPNRWYWPQGPEMTDINIELFENAYRGIFELSKTSKVSNA